MIRTLLVTIMALGTIHLHAQTMDELNYIQHQYYDKGNVDAGLDELSKIYDTKKLTLQSDSTITCFLLYYMLNVGLRLKGMNVSREKLLLTAKEELEGVNDSTSHAMYADFVYYNMALLYDNIGSYFKAANYAQKYCNLHYHDETKSDKYANCLVIMASNDNRRYDKDINTEKRHMDEALKIYPTVDDSKAPTEFVLYKLRLAEMYAGINCAREFEEIEHDMLSRDTVEFSNVPFALHRLRNFMYIKNSMFALADKSITKEDIDKGCDIGVYKLIALYYMNKSSFNDWLPTVLNSYRQYTASHTNIMSRKELEDVWVSITEDLQFINGMALHRFPTPENLEKVYDNILFVKNFRYDRSHSTRVFENGHKDLTKIPQKEAALMSYYKTSSSTSPDYQGIRKSTRKDEALIEFVKEVSSDSVTHYPTTTIGALICRSSYRHPIYVRLCSDALLREQSAKSRPDTLYSKDNRLLYDSLAAKLIPYMDGVKHIYYSSVGIMNDINLSLISNGHKRLGDLYDIRFVSSTAYASHLKKQERRYHTACLFGGIDYNEASEPMQQRNGSMDRSGFDYLAASKEEVDSIGHLLKDAGINVKLFEGSLASETAIKSLSGGAPDILHISTHGGYLKDIRKQKFLKYSQLEAFEDQFMSLNYLLFSGANDSWNGMHKQEMDKDGILTAAEIGQLDFSKSKIVVLSACETGLGVTSYPDGTYGLLRGFKLADAETVVMTLWKVNDEIAKDFMLAFYRKLVSGTDRFKAFLYAQRIIKKQHSSPSDWGAFIMMD